MDEDMTISAVSPSVDGWNLDRRDSSGKLYWHRHSTKVKFCYDVEILEFTKDPAEDRSIIYDRRREATSTNNSSQALIVCATCVAAIAVTVILPWVLIGGTS